MRFAAVTLLTLVAAVMASPDGLEKRQAAGPKVQDAVKTDGNGNVVAIDSGGALQQSVTDEDLAAQDEAEIQSLEDGVDVDNQAAEAEADAGEDGGAGAGANGGGLQGLGGQGGQGGILGGGQGGGQGGILGGQGGGF